MSDRHLRQFLYSILAAVYWSAFAAADVRAESVTVAVASNFMAPMKAVAEKFEEATGHDVNLAFGSSGKLYAQILNGAPFHLFLSADQTKPHALQRAGLHLSKEPFTYATGKLALVSDRSLGSWSNQTPVSPRHLLETNEFDRLAIANPQVAPYGEAAVDVLDYLGLQAQFSTKIVRGTNISQAYQFVSSGNASLGFVALSQVLHTLQLSEQALEESDAVWIVPEYMHKPIRQDMLLLRSGEQNMAALELFDWIKSEQIQMFITNFGYSLTDQDAGVRAEK